MGKVASEEEVWVRACLDKWRDGNEQAFGELLQHYRPALVNMMNLRIGNQLAARLDASDVLQEAFFDAQQKGAEFLGNSRVEFYVWLRGIARDRLYKLQRTHLGAKQRTVEREVRLPERSSMDLAGQLLSPERTPASEARRGEIRELLRRVIDALSPVDREVILMRHFERLSNQQAAQAMNVPPSTAAMRHGRALARLRDLLSAEISQGDLE